MQNVPTPPTVPRLAATVMLVRPSPRGTIEVYLTRRHARSRFMPDAFVFPGGSVDASDRSTAQTLVRGNAGNAPGELVVAAVRETFEEAGVLLASDSHGEPARLEANALATARAALSAGDTLADVLARYELSIDADRLAYYSNWVTPVTEPIRFDTHFFIARAPADQVAAADATEVYDGMWLSPSDAVALGARGEMTIRFPTLKHLERLADFSDVDDLLLAARARTVTRVEPIDAGDGDFTFDATAW